MTMPAAILMSKVMKVVPQPSVNDYSDADELGLRSFCVAFQPDDKIHLFPPCKQIAHLLKDTVEKHWTLDWEDPNPNCYSITLQSTPFIMCTRRENAMLIKFICCLLLDRFKSHGWELVVCTDLSAKTDLSAWYFARLPTRAGHAPSRSPTDANCGIVCLSLSTTKKLQLINAPSALQSILREAVVANYDPGIEQDAHYGRDYQIKLKGNPWDTEDRDEIVAACKVLLATFKQFCAHGYQLYGLVNLKETADSFFFEYDPSETLEDNRYMLITLDDSNILRMINATPSVVDVVKIVIDHVWLLGIEAEGQIGSGSPKKAVQEKDLVSWEFVLKGSPWNTAASKIGGSRQFITSLLDALLANGWTVVTGLDISRSTNKKSALLFQRCPSVRGIRHACLSPLGKQRYQLINAPSPLRQLVRNWFDDVVTSERLSQDHSVYELVFSGRSWWVQDPEEEDSYIYVRKQMGGLLQALMDGGWRVIASADVARQAQADADVGEGIHSWFVIYCGIVTSDCLTAKAAAIKVTANSTLQVGGRGHPRPQYSYPCRVRSERRPQHKVVSAVRSSSFRPSSSSPRRRGYNQRALSPPTWAYDDAQKGSKRSQSHQEISLI